MSLKTNLIIKLLLLCSILLTACTEGDNPNPLHEQPPVILEQTPVNFEGRLLAIIDDDFDGDGTIEQARLFDDGDLILEVGAQRMVILEGSGAHEDRVDWADHAFVQEP